MKVYPQGGQQDGGHEVVVTKVEVNTGDDSGWLTAAVEDPARPYEYVITHVYSEGGAYEPQARVTFWDGEVITITYRIINILSAEEPGGESSGEEGFDEEDEWVIRDFTDPRDGTTYEIIDGRALVAFFMPVDMDAAWQFVADEKLDILSEWWMIGAINVLLPEETSVEEAVGEWPDEYPDLVESVDPDAVVEVD